MSNTPNLALMPLYTDEMFFTLAQSELPNPDLGSYNKKVLVLYAAAELTPSTDEMLRKMMQSCRIEESDYYRIGLNNPALIAPLIRLHQPETLLLFGLPWQNGSFSIQKNPYSPFRFAGIKCLLSDGLNTLQQKPELKKELWNKGLKYLFQIN
jgi:hypothetical protein